MQTQTLIIVILILVSVLTTPLSLKALIDREKVRSEERKKEIMEKPSFGNKWAFHEEIPGEAMETWAVRRIMAYGENMMLVENEFEPGDTAPEHTHHHAQITYVIEGALKFTLDGETRTLRKGDSVYIRPFAVHSAEAVEKSLLIDMFSPMREDFVE